MFLFICKHPANVFCKQPASLNQVLFPGYTTYLLTEYLLNESRSLQQYSGRHI